jgi:hypothetical protein
MAYIPTCIVSKYKSIFKIKITEDVDTDISFPGTEVDLFIKKNSWNKDKNNIEIERQKDTEKEIK